MLTKVAETPYSAFFYSPPRTGKEISYFFTKPDNITHMSRLSDVDSFLSSIDFLKSQKKVGYSLLPYELGLLFEHRLRKILTDSDVQSILENTVLVSFQKNKLKEIKSSQLKFPEQIREGFDIQKLKIALSRKDFQTKINQIKRAIERGETYQVNFTTSASFTYNGNSVDLFLHLLSRQSADYSAFINLPGKQILSLSPELFLSINKRSVTTRPMKGTTVRGKNIVEDEKNRNEFATSEKNKAENLMIVDLLRNDLNKCSSSGSVSVKRLFEIEKYESLFQLTSTITSTIPTENPISKVLRDTFPSGSITGAPKIRTMEIIHHLENAPRGMYTGSIGALLPNKSSFSIGIRTLEMDTKKRIGRLGIGAGITWGSNAADEYEEVLLKGKFLIDRQPDFNIITSFFVERGKPLFIKDHVLRLKETASFFLFPFNLHAIKKELQRVLIRLKNDKNYKVRILLSKFGSIEISTEVLVPRKADRIKVILSESLVDENNPFMYFKTTNRAHYDEELENAKKNGYDEVLFRNKQGHLTEGAVSNIFLKINGRWITPAIEDGLLNGVYRKHFIKTEKCEEKSIKLSDIRKAEEIILTNSVRKIIPVETVAYKGKVIFAAK